MLPADRRGTHRPCLTVQVVLEDQYAVTPPLILKLRGHVAMSRGQPGLAGPRQRTIPPWRSSLGHREAGLMHYAGLTLGPLCGI